MSSNVTAGQEALVGVFRSKMPFQENRGNYSQTLVAGAALTAASGGVTSKNTGNPVFIDLLLTASAAATFQVFHSKDGIKFYHDPANDVVFAGAGDRVVRIFGAPFIKVAVSADQATAWVDLIAKH